MIAVAASSAAVQAEQQQPTISKSCAWHTLSRHIHGPTLSMCMIACFHCISCFCVLIMLVCCIAGAHAAQRPYLQTLQTTNLTHREPNSMGNSAEGQHQHLPGLLSDQQVPQASALGQVHTHPATAGTAPRPTGRWDCMGTLATEVLIKVCRFCCMSMSYSADAVCCCKSACFM